MPAVTAVPSAARRRLAVLGVAAALVATTTSVTTAAASPEGAAAVEQTVPRLVESVPPSLGEQAGLVAQFEAQRARAEVAAAKARAKAKAERVRKARAAARERAARAAQRNPKGTARALMADKYGWGADQFRCLESLWQRESNWSYRARNRYSGAYGIPQALPGAKMASAGADWRTNPRTQILWGLGYIKGVYGTPCGALGHSNAAGWY